MPDWLSSRPEKEKTESAPRPVESANLDSLTPADLPSWVQAMRPVDAVISEGTSDTEDQFTESEGPLAGFAGVIPTAPIGSSRRPKAISLMLQATDEQQKSAALLEQILLGETNPRPLTGSVSLVSQRMLRWGLSALFFLVLGTILALGSKIMPISAILPEAVSHVSDAVANIPGGAKVLVVIDYEPSLAGEMEAVSGPLLAHMVLSRHPTFTFLSTSPNSSALVERLMTDTRINQPAPAGLEYQAGNEIL